MYLIKNLKTVWLFNLAFTPDFFEMNLMFCPTSLSRFLDSSFSRQLNWFQHKTKTMSYNANFSVCISFLNVGLWYQQSWVSTCKGNPWLPRAVWNPRAGYRLRIARNSQCSWKDHIWQKYGRIKNFHCDKLLWPGPGSQTSKKGK